MSEIQTNVVKPNLSFTYDNQEFLILNREDETALDGKVNEIYDFMTDNLSNGQNGTEEQKDQLYSKAQTLWSEYAELLKSVKYNFYLNQKQYTFLTNLINTKLEYDVNTVFFAIELTETMLNLRDVKYVGEQILPNPVNATEITYIYHLISGHKVKGLTSDAYRFSEILVRIGNISKVFNYYDSLAKTLSSDVQNWVAQFDVNVSLAENVETTTVNVIEPTTTKPKKSTKANA